MRKSQNIIIDATFHVPYSFSQSLVIMYKDIITSEKYPAFYILMNKKNYRLYDIVLKSVINILTQNKLYKLNINTITDEEFALIKSIKNNFIYANHFLCLYNFKENMINELRLEGLMKNSCKAISIEITNKLSKLTIDYNGSIKYINDEIEKIKFKNPEYINFITNNYYVKNKLKFFVSGELNYNLLPKDCRSISYLENYNKIIKQSLGKNRYIYWINYIHFIKTESPKIKNKIYDNCNKNILYNAKFSKFGIEKYINDDTNNNESNKILKDNDINYRIIKNQENINWLKNASK